MPVYMLIGYFPTWLYFTCTSRYTNIDHKVIILIVICKHFYFTFCKSHSSNQDIQGMPGFPLL